MSEIEIFLKWLGESNIGLNGIFVIVFLLAFKPFVINVDNKEENNQGDMYQNFYDKEGKLDDHIKK